MKEEIIIKAADLFLNLGFKSVTMDDLANELGISKKTIYSHFPNKAKLVQASTLFILNTIDQGIEKIKEKELNAIVEMFEIKNFVMNHLKNEKSSPQFQLQKYYPQVYKSVQNHHFDTMQCSINDNLEKGIKEGLYRENIPLEFIGKIYFLCVSAIKASDLFPPEQFSIMEINEKYLEYHLRAIVTEKGLKTLKEFLPTEY
ncbi:TetR/AcrR family transcriptional regulator [Gillisia limnaea]|uniref:Transcriptional regulator, TetR family n=1 Tax=Gillisia limnaea (strain DSM 15749 / LMG 21470 / R-8282) TaxID=865937 RepID=H2BWS0_GILLR|nr:TetR/AcrR family transcriptional regulator [Gillisia limnaea]EHQ03048.1 transcriptional regulator, TetR family [Gillisia limnaea DSM 15749]